MADHTIIVAGATGDLGRRIAPALLDRGARPRLIHPTSVEAFLMAARDTRAAA